MCEMSWSWSWGALKKGKKEKKMIAEGGFNYVGDGTTLKK